MRCASRLIVVVGVVWAAGCVERAEQPAAREGPPVDRTAECRWAADAVAIDGKADEPAWKDAQVLQRWVVFWQQRPAKSATRARLLWDDKNLYFSADMDDADLYADVKQHNDRTWENDVFELFFKPAQDRLTYYELQVNAANTRLELFLPSRGAGGYRRFAPTTRFGMESAVRLQGTLNDWRDADKGWAVEGSIPWSAFAPSGGRPKSGATWKFALCRYDYSVAFDRPETSSTAPLTQPDFHRYEDYGELTFIGKK
jgi:hypothetical protein